MASAETPPGDVATGVAARPSGRLAAWTLLLSILVLAPIFVFPNPGLQDYPNHLARAFILLHRTDPIVERFYAIEWSTLPNLGWDLWALAVGRILPLELTGKLFLALGSASILIGCFTLSRALHGEWTWTPLLAVPFLFNSGFTKGFLNFNLGAGCALLAAAWWIWLGEGRWKLRLAGATLFSTLLCLIHFYGWAFYGVFVLGYELQRIMRAKQPRRLWADALLLCRDALQGVPALVMACFAAVSVSTEFTIAGFYPPYLRLFQFEHLIDIGDVLESGIFVVGVALLAIPLFRYRWLRFRSDFCLILVLCIVLFFVLPDRISGTDYVSWRVLLMALLIAIASLSPSAEADCRLDRVMGGVTLVTAIIVGVLLWSGRNAEIGRRQFLAVIRNVPAGSALFVVHNGMTSAQLTRYAVGEYHVGAYAVLDKRALVQSMFVYPGQQLLRFRDPALQSTASFNFPFLAKLMERFEAAGLDVAAHIRRFQYVIIHGPIEPGELQLLPAGVFTLVDQVGDFRLYRANEARPDSLGLPIRDDR